MSVRFRPDAHLFPLYAKFAADCYRRDDLVNGNQFFRLTCDSPRDTEHKVYKQMFKIKPGLPNEPEIGRKAFWDVIPSYTSTSQEKAQAIDRALRKCDRVELQKREHHVHKCLWKVHERPRGDRDYGNHTFNHTHGRYSSLEDKLTAIRMCADESRPFSWVMNNEIVHLVKRQDGELETLIVSDSQKSKRAPFNRGAHSIEEAISLLKDCDVTVQGDSVTPYKLHVVNNFDYRFLINENREIRLLLKGNTPIWHEYNKSKKTARWTNVSANDVQRISSLTRLSNEHCESALKDFTIDVSTEPGTGKLISINLGKISFPSKMDPTKTVDRDNWSVTLVSEGYSSACKDLPLDPGFGHAKLVFEGVRGGYFIKYAHLTDTNAPDFIVPSGYARLAVGDYNLERNEIKARTPTWIRSGVLVQKLEEDDKKLCLFNHTGNLSFSPQLSGNLGREIVHIVSGAIVDTLREATSPSSQRLTENRLINALSPNCGASFHGKVGIIFVSALANKTWNEIREPSHWVHDYNCLTLVIKKLRELGLMMPSPNPLLAVPNEYVRAIAENPSLVRINET
jgi:hypothetical protein